MCAPFCQRPVQLPARARSLFLVKNVRVRADGHIGSVTYVSPAVTYLGEVAAMPPRPSAPARHRSRRANTDRR